MSFLADLRTQGPTSGQINQRNCFGPCHHSPSSVELSSCWSHHYIIKILSFALIPQDSSPGHMTQIMYKSRFWYMLKNVLNKIRIHLIVSEASDGLLPTPRTLSLKADIEGSCRLSGPLPQSHLSSIIDLTAPCSGVAEDLPPRHWPTGMVAVSYLFHGSRRHCACRKSTHLLCSLSYKAFPFTHQEPHAIIKSPFAQEANARPNCTGHFGFALAL